jgi:hypothetical protein
MELVLCIEKLQPSKPNKILTAQNPKEKKIYRSAA